MSGTDPDPDVDVDVDVDPEDDPQGAVDRDVADYFRSPDDVESQVFDWGVLKWMATPETGGAGRISCGVVKLEPGKGHERHNHPEAEEMLYVVRGTGEQEIAGETREISAGEMLFVPQGVYHGTVNTGWEPLVLIAVYAPPGPETQLREMPECTVVPAGEPPTEENVERYRESEDASAHTDGNDADGGTDAGSD